MVLEIFVRSYNFFDSFESGTVYHFYLFSLYAKKSPPLPGRSFSFQISVLFVYTSHSDLVILLIGKDIVLVRILLLLNRTLDDSCQADYVCNECKDCNHTLCCRIRVGRLCCCRQL